MLLPDIKGVTSDMTLSLALLLKLLQVFSLTVLLSTGAPGIDKKKKKKKAPCSRFKSLQHVEKSKANNMGAQSCDYICVHAMFLMRLEMF